MRRPCGVVLAVVLAAAVGPAAHAQPAAAPKPEDRNVIENPTEFVDKNVAEFRRRLEALKQKFGGSTLRLLTGGDPAEEAKKLPRPATVRYEVNFKPFAPRVIEPIRVRAGDEYYVRDLSASVLPGPFGVSRLLAVDEATATLLRLPRDLELAVTGTVARTRPAAPERDEGCCEGARTEGDARTCARFAERIDVSRNTGDDPRALLAPLQLSIAAPLDVQQRFNWSSIRATTPGLKVIEGLSSRRWSDEERFIRTRSCIPDLSRAPRGFLDFVPAGDTRFRVEVEAVKLHAFGFPGLHPDVPGRAMRLDYFTEAGRAPRSLPELLPLVALDGAAGRVTSRPAQFGALVTFTTPEPGPLVVSEKGTVGYRGGVGTTRFAASLGGSLTVTHQLTLNVIEAVLDPALADSTIAQGKSYRVALRMLGPADPTRLEVKWEGDGVTWTEGAAQFARAGQVAEAASSFTLAAGASAPRFRVTVTYRDTNEQVYALERQLRIGLPAIAATEVLVARGRAEFERADRPVDVFFPGGSPDPLRFLPQVQLSDGRSLPLRDFDRVVNFEMTSSDPSVLSLHGGQFGSPPTGQTVGRTGTAVVQLRLGGADLDPNHGLELTQSRREITAAPVTVQVKQLLLSVAETGPSKRYRLTVLGPGTMDGYVALFLGEGRRPTGFVPDVNGLPTATLTTTLRMDRVEIRAGDTALATLDIAGAAMPQAKVRLLPSEPPATTITRVPLIDAGSLEALSECRNSVTFRMESLGFEPGTTVDKFCRAKREEDKQAVAAQRGAQRQQNRLVRELERQGEELVVFADTMKVGAALTGLPTRLAGTIFCRWTLVNAGVLRVERPVTPVERVSETDGACFNVVQGIENGLDPAAEIRVELMVSVAAGGPPQVVEGGRVRGFSGALPGFPGR